MKTITQQIKSHKKIGSVLVIGGGIGGMQTSLDLANIGFKVYLVDKQPSIGGRMSQLDKTFPTNDCSMCILSPKLVDIARHPNIELFTYSEVEDIKGKCGNFAITINKKARSIDAEKCTSCELCTKNCPVLLEPQLQKKPKHKPKVRDEKYLNNLLSKYSSQKSSLIQIMIEINDKYRYLPKDILKYLSYKLGIPLSSIFQVATFYKAFSLEPRGKFHIKICLGTACHVRGVSKIVDKVKSQIDSAKEGLFSLETVNCLGACALGPVMVVNDDVYGHMTVDKVDKIIDSRGPHK
jgi:NADH:ubiquinone oxidoreductase subunit E